MILKEKLLSTYTSKELIKILGKYNLECILKEKLDLSRSIIFKKISFLEFNYTFDDFKVDFNKELVEITEKKLYYNLLCKKHNLSTFSSSLGLSSYESIENILKKGIESVDYNTLAFIYSLIDTEIDLSSFKVKDIHFYSDHCTIYSTKNDLLNFKIKYNIPYEICLNKRNSQWSFAFTGWVYLKIRDSINPNFKINISFKRYWKYM